MQNFLRVTVAEVIEARAFDLHQPRAQLSA